MQANTHQQPQTTPQTLANPFGYEPPPTGAPTLAKTGQNRPKSAKTARIVTFLTPQRLIQAPHGPQIQEDTLQQPQTTPQTLANTFGYEPPTTGAPKSAKIGQHRPKSTSRDPSREAPKWSKIVYQTLIRPPAIANTP